MQAAAGFHSQVASAKWSDLPSELCEEVLLSCSTLESFVRLGRASSQMYSIMADPNVKAKWLIRRFGLSQVLKYDDILGHPLMRAEVVECMLNRGAHFNQLSDLLHFRDCSPSQAAARCLAFQNQPRKRPLHLLNWLIEQDRPTLIHCYHRHDSSNLMEGNGLALYDAIGGGKVRACQALIECGADVNINDGELLRLAVGSGNERMARFLVDRAGAKVVSRPFSWATAARDNAIGLLEWARSLGLDLHFGAEEALIECCTHGSLRGARLALDMGSSPDAQNALPLRRSAERGHWSIVALLQQSGADLELARRYGGATFMALMDECQTKTARGEIGGDNPSNGTSPSSINISNSSTNIGSSPAARYEFGLVSGRIAAVRSITRL
ncbi:uncharacterized protein BJ171DRAFT_631373 [Polychytrium aggregatum]|uniref:uncharacterized protein n=1 Tax=Polychytrium aggregatum TaxID=110093 RepID=UPI0022FE1D0B|nr:uncharacterized protein BJ171DRAFT_631373 [Polychytrium aggregatum]KAI9208704.1 hypothetical protein BJ171DRAFT_631373 [Polychytrium aggregatum]